ncbi:MAG: MFS transporter, partial [Phycisphaerales bacterium]|nr:MFS transporter [Phycisphaerales bacterium]
MQPRPLYNIPLRMLDRLTRIHPEECLTTILAAVCFFLIMCGYFMLRPIRETMGLDQHIDDLHWLFLGTLTVMIPTSLGFSWLASRLSRRNCITTTFIIVLICLAGFTLALTVFDRVLGPWTGRIFYVWLSVINVLIISAFWVTVVDNHRPEQGRRLFAFIAVGGTLGAIVGPIITATTIHHLGEPLLLCTAYFCFALTLAILRFVLFPAFDRKAYVVADGQAHSRRRIGGSAINGLLHLFTNPRLGLLALYIISFTILASLLYFEQARLIKEALPERTDRTRLFGWMGVGSQTATILLQLFITSRILTRFGLAPALLALPLLMLFGFFTLTLTPDMLAA